MPGALERALNKDIQIVSRGDIPLRWLTSILLLIFPTATLFVNRGDSYVFGLLTLIGVWVWLRDGARRWLDRPAALLWSAFALYFAVALLSYLVGTQTDAGFRFLGRYLRFLLVVPVYLALRRYPPTARTVFIGLALGALIAGVIGGLQFYHMDAVVRIEATTGLSIIFGDLATTMTLCAVAGFGFLANSRRRWAVPLLFLCVAGGTAATLLSGTRGAWIPLLLLPLILVTRFSGSLKRRYALVIILVLLAVLSSFYLMLDSGTHSRIADVDKSLKNYIIVLQYIDAPDNGVFSGPVCVDAANFLRAWLGAGRTVSGTLDAAVVADPSLDNAAGCRADYAVRLHNSATGTVAQRVFLRIPSRGVSGQQTSMLMRGTGTMAFAGKGHAMASINSREYHRYSLTDHKSAGDLVNVFIAPGQTIWLVPLDSHPGEYSLSIANNPVGQRLEMWRAAWMMFLRHPVFGTGTGTFEGELGNLIAQGRIAGFVRGYDHPHNDYLNALSGAGLVGLVVLLVILGLPIWYFFRYLRKGNHTVQALSMAGLLTVVDFVIYALTDTIFLHSMMITWYVVYMALFYALLAVQECKRSNPETPKP